MGSSEGQTYCLRWNNHKSNLVEILDALIKMECYVDCTIYVDDQVQFKAHRVVLAANSPYFQSILQDVPMDHCSILFPGVQEFEMRALLEYMYTGEVNVTQAQIPRIMKIAEQLEVKGLYDMADLKGRFNKMVDVDHLMRDRDPATTLLASNNNYSSKGSSATGSASATASSSSAWKDVPPTSSSGSSSGGGVSGSHYSHHHQQHQSSPVISTSTNISIAQSSSSSPPYSYKSPYSSLYSRSPGAVERDREREERSRDRSSSFSHPATSPHRIQSTSGSTASSVSAQIALQASQVGGNHQSSTHQSGSSSGATSATSAQPSTAAAAAALAAGWPGLGQTQLHSMLSSAYDSSTDMNPLKRKKLQSMSSMLRDTPILRNVLAQANPADSSQSTAGAPASAAATVATIQTIQGSMKPDPERPSSHHSNGSGYKSIKEPSHSPYADKSFDDDLLDSPHNFSGDARLASYVPHQQQKPEWKRYKQYTRTDILNAIECVRKGMSALQASRKFGVPSRTLYDKVKKLGITTGRPINRALKRSPSSSGSPASFPYGLSGASHMFGPGSGAPGGPHPGDHHQQLPSQSQQQDEEASAAAAAAAAAAAMAHHEAGRMIKLEHGSHHGLPPTIPHPAAALLDPSFLQQALEARGGDIAGREALHAMAFAAAAHAAVNGMSTSPGTHGTARSPSPSVLMKYMRSVSMSSPEDERHHAVQQQRERDLIEARDREGHHHNGSDPGYARHDHPMEQDSIDETGSECGERPPSAPEGPVQGPDDHVEDLSMGPKRDSEERGSSVSPPPSAPASVVRTTQRSRSPSPQPAPPSLPPQQQGVIVPAPGKLKEDYNISIKREIIADSNAPSESS
uniref:BTB domain-containing protein n=1 Tax=Anopheles epiroticus TaxID=199890 RepID=A0A182PP17_9DIPT